MESILNFSPSVSGYKSGVWESHIGEKMKLKEMRKAGNSLESLRICLDAKYIEELLNLSERTTGGRLSFRRISMTDIPLLRQYFSRYANRSCDFSLGGVMMWVDFFNYEMAIAEGSLFIKGYDKESDTTLFYQPVGNIDRKKAREMIAQNWRGKSGKAIYIENVESSYEEYCDSLAEDDRFRDAWKEYLYEVGKFCNFPGKKMEKKRNHLNYFRKHYENTTFEEISDANSEELIAFTKEYAKSHEDSPLFNYESSQTMKVLENYSAYRFDGLLVRHEGKVIGYTFGERCGDTFHVHVEKGNVLYQGVYQMLASTLAEMVAERYPDVSYLNREEDMGDESLRKSKESYHPSLIVNKRVYQL